jgi:hypothetical protein
LTVALRLQVVSAANIDGMVITLPKETNNMLGDKK